MVIPSNFNPKISSRHDNIERSQEKRSIPKGDKDFKRVMADADEGSRDQEDELVKKAKGEKEGIEEQAEENLPSLLSLASKQKNKLKDYSDSPTPEYFEETPEEPKLVADTNPKLVREKMDDRTSVKGKEEMVPQQNPYQPVAKRRELDPSKDKPVAQGSPFSLFKEVGHEKKEKGFSQFSQEQPDLAYVNPLNMPLEKANASSQVADAKPVTRAPYIQSIVNQMIEKLQTVRTETKTDTIITLKHPPMFAGANLIVTSFDTAKKEFNIAFENLRPDAKRLLDLQQNRNDLKLALEEKGYGVHIIVTTTEIEHPITVAQASAEQSSRDRRDEDAGKQQGQKKRQGQG